MFKNYGYKEHRLNYKIVDFFRKGVVTDNYTKDVSILRVYYPLVSTLLYKSGVVYTWHEIISGYNISSIFIQLTMSFSKKKPTKVTSEVYSVFALVSQLSASWKCYTLQQFDFIKIMSARLKRK